MSTGKKGIAQSQKGTIIVDQAFHFNYRIRIFSFDECTYKHLPDVILEWEDYYLK